MIRIMDTTKTLNALVTDNTNGLGQITPIEAIVTEELNGIYEASISVSATDKHFGDLSVGGILKMPVNEAGNEQLFRINAITKPMNGICTLECSHITYDLNKVAVKPFTSTGAVATKNAMMSNMIGSYPFMMTTDMTNTTSKFTLDIPRSFRECLGGYEGSLLDVFRGEYEYDNLTVKMLAHRGSDNGVRISYGKNLTDFSQDEQMDNVYTSVLGYAVVNDTTYTGNVYHKVQATYPKVMIVDFSSDYETDATPTTAELTAKAQAYAQANDIEVPKVNMEISFVPLYQTEEYKNIAPLERVSLGDTVHVYFEKLGVEASARVIRTEWNVLLNRYESVELGKAKANLNTIINEATQQAKTDVAQDQGFLEGQLNQMASLIINGLGLHRTLVPVDGGGYRIYLHNKPTLAESDTQYVFTAEGFLVSTDYGQTWNAGFDSQGNAVLNSLATITLKALEIIGSRITFGDPDDKYIVAAPYAMSGNAVGISFDGSGYVRFQPQEEFNVNNIDANGDSINEMRLFKESSQSRFSLRNYNYTSKDPANSINLTSQDDQNANNIQVTNYNPTDSLLYNQLAIRGTRTLSSVSLSNYSLRGADSTHINMTGTANSDVVEMSIFEATGSSSSKNLYVAIEQNSSGAKITLYSKPNGKTRGARIVLDGTNETVDIYANHVNFNGVQKW